MYCLSCEDEFLEHVENCSSCGVKLVSDEEFLAKKVEKNEIKPDEEDIITFVEGSLPQIKDMEKILKMANISYVINAHGHDCSKNSCSAQFSLLMKKDDAILARDFLEKKFSHDVLKEGQGEVITKAVDLTCEQITCPACGEIGPLKNGECSFCGLFLGVREI